MHWIKKLSWSAIFYFTGAIYGWICGDIIYGLIPVDYRLTMPLAKLLILERGLSSHAFSLTQVAASWTGMMLPYLGKALHIDKRIKLGLLSLLIAPLGVSSVLWVFPSNNAFYLGGIGIVWAIVWNLVIMRRFYITKTDTAQTLPPAKRHDWRDDPGFAHKQREEPRPPQTPRRKGAERKGGDQNKTCPYCAETIKAEAVKCRYCHEMLI